MENVQIRVAKREELPFIVTLYNLMWVRSKSLIDLKTGENIFDRMQKKGQSMYVVAIDERVIGCFMVLMKGKGASASTSECVVENVVIHPDYRRKGIGRQVMTFVTDKCREEGCHRLFVASGEKRERSSEFYESLGFKRKGYGFVKRID